MDSGNSKGKLSDHPMVVLLGLIASLIGIYVFITGYESINQIFNNDTPPIPTSTPTLNPAAITIPFYVTSEDALEFAIAGTFEGEYNVDSNSIETVINSATIVYQDFNQPYDGRHRVDYFIVGLATYTDANGNWDIKYKSKVQPIGVELKKLDRYTFPSLIVANIPIDSSVDLSQYWLVFEMSATMLDITGVRVSYSYAHSEENIIIDK